MNSIESAEERRDRIAELTRQGLSAPLIAEIVGVSPRTVTRARGARGCAQPAADPMTDAEIATAKAKLDDGASYSEVARTIGRSKPAVIRRIPGYGWDRHAGGQYGRLVRSLTLLEGKTA